jgi:hypothetical protein
MWAGAEEAARLHRRGDSGTERRGPSAPRRHNPRGPLSGASSAAGPPLSDAGRRTSGELARRPPPYPGHYRDMATWVIGGWKGRAAPLRGPDAVPARPPTRGGVEPPRPHSSKRGHAGARPLLSRGGPAALAYAEA